MNWVKSYATGPAGAVKSFKKMNNYIYNEILNFHKNRHLKDLKDEKIKKNYFWNQCFDKSRLKNFVLWFLSNYGEYKTVELVEELKNLGFQYATKAGISLGIDDLKIPPKKTDLIFEAEKLTLSTSNEYKRGEITGVERFQRLIDTWHRTSERLKQEVIDHFEATDILNPVYMMAFSGARGNISQVRQLVGMRGLMANPQGQIIDFPIRSNFREGLTLTEYVISSYGARKGIVDTALRTANAGYLTRRLVDVAQHVIISNFDCKTRRGIFLMDMKEGNKTIYSLQNRLVGRVLAKNIYSLEGQKNFETINKESISKSAGPPPKGEAVGKDSLSLLAKRNTEISVDLAFEIAKVSKKVFVRSSLTCGTKKLVCQLCYGWSLAQGNLVSIGEAVGVIAAQSIGEPGTQLTMRTFHTGGVFSGDVTDQIKAPFNGFIEYVEPIAGTLIRTPEGKIAFLTKMEGSFIIKKNLEDSVSLGNKLEINVNKNFKKYKIPSYTLIFKRMGEIVFEKEVIAQISSISRQKNATDDAELTIKSDFEGQFYAKTLELQETKVGPKLTTKQKKLLSNFYKTRKSNSILKKKRKYSFSFYLKKFKRSLPLDNVYEAWNWGYAWILSGKIYQLQYPSSFFPILGDYINRQTLMNEIKCRFHVEGLSSVLEFQSNVLLNHNRKFLTPLKKQRIFKDRAFISSYFKTSNFLAQENNFETFLKKSDALTNTKPKGLAINNSIVAQANIQPFKLSQTLPFGLDKLGPPPTGWGGHCQGLLGQESHGGGAGPEFGKTIGRDRSSFPIIKNSLLSFDLKKIFYKKFGYWIKFNEGLNPSLILKKTPLQTSLNNFLEKVETDKKNPFDPSFPLSKNDLLLLFSSFNQNETNSNFNQKHYLSNFEDKSTSFSTSNWLPNSKFILTWYPKNSEINASGLLSVEQPSFASSSYQPQRGGPGQTFCKSSAKQTLENLKKNHIFFISLQQKSVGGSVGGALASDSKKQKIFKPSFGTFVIESKNLSSAKQGPPQPKGLSLSKPKGGAVGKTSSMNDFFKIKKQKTPLSFKILKNDLFLNETNQKTLKTNDFTDVISLLKEKKYKTNCEVTLNFKNVFILNNLERFLKNKPSLVKQCPPQPLGLGFAKSKGGGPAKKFEEKWNTNYLPSKPSPLGWGGGRPWQDLKGWASHKKVNPIRNKGDLSYFFLKKELLKKRVSKNNKITKEKNLNSPLVGNFNHSFFKLKKNISISGMNDFKKKKKNLSDFNSGSNKKSEILIYNLNKGEELEMKSVHFGMRWKNSYNYKNSSLNYLLRKFDLNSMKFKTNVTAPPKGLGKNNIKNFNLSSNKKVSKLKNSKMSSAVKAAAKIANLSESNKNAKQAQPKGLGGGPALTRPKEFRKQLFSNIYNLTFRKQVLTKPDVRLFFIPQIAYNYNNSFFTFLNSDSLNEHSNLSTVQLINKPLFYQINRQGYVKFFYIKKNPCPTSGGWQTNIFSSASAFKTAEPNCLNEKSLFIQKRKLDFQTFKTNSLISSSADSTPLRLSTSAASKFYLAKLKVLPNSKELSKNKSNLPSKPSLKGGARACVIKNQQKENSLTKKFINLAKIKKDYNKNYCPSKPCPNGRVWQGPIGSRQFRVNSAKNDFYNISQIKNFKLIVKLRNLLKEKTLYKIKQKIRKNLTQNKAKNLVSHLNNQTNAHLSRLLYFSKENNLNLQSFSKKIIYKSILENKLIFNGPAQQENKKNISPTESVRVGQEVIDFSKPFQDQNISIFNLCNFINTTLPKQTLTSPAQRTGGGPVKAKGQDLARPKGGGPAKSKVNLIDGPAQDKFTKKTILSNFIKLEMMKHFNATAPYLLKNSTIFTKNQKPFNNYSSATLKGWQVKNLSFVKNSYIKRKNLCSNHDIEKISQNLDFRFNKLNAMLNIFFKSLASSASSDLFSKIRSLSTLDFLRGSVANPLRLGKEQLKKDKFRKTIETKRLNLSLQRSFDKKANISANQNIKMSPVDQSKNSFYFQVKFGWLYFSKNLWDYISFHKKFISPGKKIIDDLIFENHSYYIEYVSLNRDFSQLQGVRKNLSKMSKNPQNLSATTNPNGSGKAWSCLEKGILKPLNKWNWVGNKKSRFLPCLALGVGQALTANSFAKSKIGILIRKVNEYKQINLSKLKNNIYNFSVIKNKLYKVSTLYSCQTLTSPASCQTQAIGLGLQRAGGGPDKDKGQGFDKKDNFIVNKNNVSNLDQRSFYLKKKFISKIFFQFNLKNSLINQTNQYKIRSFYLANKGQSKRVGEDLEFSIPAAANPKGLANAKPLASLCLGKGGAVAQLLFKMSGLKKAKKLPSLLGLPNPNKPGPSLMGGARAWLGRRVGFVLGKIRFQTFFINKSFSSLYLLNKEFKNPLINKQKITLQTISNFPNIDFNISSNFELYYARKSGCAQTRQFSNNTKSRLAPKNRNKSKELTELRKNLKFENKKTSSVSKKNKIKEMSISSANKSFHSNLDIAKQAKARGGGPGLPRPKGLGKYFKEDSISLPIFCRKPINYSSFFLAFNQSYGLKGTFPNIFSVFNYKTNLTFHLNKFNNSKYLNVFIERYLLKLRSCETNVYHGPALVVGQADHSNESEKLTSISIKTTLTAPPKSNDLNKGQPKLPFSEISVLIPTIFSCPCFSYSLTQHLDQTFFINKNFNRFYQKDKMTNSKGLSKLKHFNEVALVERKISKLNALSNKVELKTQFFSALQNKFRSSDALAKISYYSSFEGELIYKKDLNSLLSPESGRNSKTEWLFPIYNENTALILTKDDLISFSLNSKQNIFNNASSTQSNGLDWQNIRTPLLASEKNKKYYINNILIKLSNFDELSKNIQDSSSKLSNFKSPKQTILKVSKLASGLPSKVNKLYLGEFVMYGDKVKDHLAILSTGQIIHMNQRKITLRRGQPIFISPKAILHKYHGDLIHSKASVITLAYSQLKTGDIIQGIPKVEQFFEARTTKRGRLFRDSLPNLLKALFKRYLSKLSFKKAVRQSFYKIQQIIIDGVQRVYRAQGVSIADKHLEIIVKQMTSKVRISFAGVTGFFPGEIVDLHLVEYANDFVTKKVQYEPLVLGITKASLEVTSFLSAASFQQTTRVLSKAAVSRKSDFLKGLKENVILGNLIPAGTGLLVYLEKQKVIDSIIEEKSVSINSELIKNLVTKK